MSYMPTDQEVKKYNLETAQDLRLFKSGFIKQDLPKNLIHKDLKHYHIDNVLMVEIKEVRGIYYVHKNNIEDLMFIISDPKPLFLSAKTREKEEYFISRDIVAEDLKTATEQQKRLGER